MQRLARVLWVWLFAAALPLQGMAAATMQACGMQRGVTQAAMHAMPAAAVQAAMTLPYEVGSGHGHPAAHVPCHGQPTQGHADDAPPCSLCAVCGGQTPLSMPTGAAERGALAVAGAFAPFIAQPPPAFLTPGIERPPKRASA